MTVTEDAPAAVSAPPEPTAPSPAASGLAAVVGSGDHKVVGRIWLVAALLHAALAGTAAIAVAGEKIDLSTNEVIGSDWFGQIFAYRSIGAVFLVLLPLTIGLATAIVPLQLGASTIAFPRAAAAAVWTYLVGGGLVVAAFAMDGGPGGTDVDGVRLFVVALILVLLAEAVALICIATTVIALRVPGLSLARTPLFAWSTLVAATVWLVALPVLVGMLVISYLDIRYGGGGGFFAGGGATMYARIAWVFSTPSVYALAIPALGFIGAVVPVFAQTRHQQHRIAQGLIGAFGVFSMGAWALPGFGHDAYPWLHKAPWVAVSLLAVVPVLGLLGLWALTMRHGRLAVSSPLLFAAASLVLLLEGVSAGALQAIKPIETIVDGEGVPLFGTSWSTAVASYVVLAMVAAAFGALVFWAPKLVGRRVPEGPARGIAVLFLLAAMVWSLPDLVAGLLGQPGFPLILPLDNVSTIETLNLVSTIGGVLLALTLVGAVALLAQAARSGDEPGDDPWEGHTLEWATASPPSAANFDTVPEVASEAPLYDARHRTEEGSG